MAAPESGNGPMGTGRTRPNPETGHRQELVSVGRNQTNWVDKAEPKNPDLPHGGILLNGTRRHIDEFKGKTEDITKALSEKNTLEGKRALRGMLVQASPEANKRINQSALENRWEDKRPGASRAPRSNPSAVAEANSRGTQEKAKNQNLTGGELLDAVRSKVHDLAGQVTRVGRSEAVRRGVGHHWDTAAGHLKTALGHLNQADNARSSRQGLRSLSHIANAALFLHHANKAIHEGNLHQDGSTSLDHTNFLSRETQKHAAKNGRGNDL
jgi:hypothetical protein